MVQSAYDKRTYHIVGQHTARQIFDIFMLSVNNVCQFHTINNFLVDIHQYLFHESIWLSQNIVANYFCNY